MAERDTIIWLGTVAPDDRVLRSAAASPAANRWQRGLLGALVRTGVRVSIVGHWPEPLFPKGPLAVCGETPSTPWGTGLAEQRWVSYLNVPFLRPTCLRSRYEHAVREVVARDPGRVLGFLSYNAFEVGRDIQRHVLRPAGIPWVAVVADADGSTKGREKLYRDTEEADGAVVLSWRVAAEWKNSPVLHLDGGVDPIHTPVPADVGGRGKAEFPFLYCGATNKWAGVDLLAEAFAGWSEPRARLWLCGKGAVKERFPLLKHDDRISCYGAVSDETFAKLADQCYALVNPRHTDLADNHVNFPSKVLEYLRYGKPVISTWTDGLEPAYRSVLSVTRDGTAAALREALAETLLWTPERLRHCSLEAKAFLAGRAWSEQAGRLRTFLDSLPKG